MTERARQIRPILLALFGMTLAAAAPIPADFAKFDASVAATKAAMMTDPDTALRRAREAFAIAGNLPAGRRADIARATAQWLEAEATIYAGNPQKAAPIVDQAMATVARVAPGTKLHGDLMRSRGAIAAIGGHVQIALRDFQNAFEIFRRAGERRSEAIALQDIGAIYLDARDYPHVLSYYAQSAETFSDDPFLLLTTHNNRGQVLRELKRYPEAIDEYRKALGDAQRMRSRSLEASILTNLAATQVDADRLDDADRSVAHARLLAASAEAPFVAGVAAEISAARGDNASAARLLTDVFKGANLQHTTMPFREFHGLAARVYEATGDERASLAHLKAFHRLDNEAEQLSASTSAQLISAKFDFANQNLKISQLKQGQLARDIRIERQQSRLRTVILSGLLGAGSIVLALLVAGFISLRRSRNKVRAANADLTVTNTKLEKALAAKTEFLAMTSHEIRTPLNGILGMTQVMLANPAIDPEMRGQVSVVHGAGEAMKALVDDILDVAKMEKGEVSLDLSDTDLHAILEETCGLWKGQTKLKSVALSLDLGNTPQRIVSDAARLRQIVFNLMSNAVKFTRSGSVALSAEAIGERLFIRVEDTGIGIPEDQHEAIFEAFRQVDGAMTREFSGTGLGLAICRRLVEAFGGTITVESAIDKGSIFTVEVPLQRATVPELSATSDLAAARFLLVEPNMLRQSMFRALLTPHVGRLAISATIDDAMRSIKAGECDHVLLDADSVCAGSAKVALQLVELAGLRGVLTTVLHAAGGEWLDPPSPATRFLAKPVAGPALLAALARDEAFAAAA